MNFAALWRLTLTRTTARKAQLRFCLRLTLAGILAFSVAQIWNFPLGGLWAVLTAIVVTQASVGSSLLAVIEYVAGTLAGGIYATAVALLIPHASPLALAGVLALSIAPLALAAAVNPIFRVAPFTAVIVLLVSTGFAQSPLTSAFHRVFEVLFGGLSVILVSFLFFPEKPYSRELQAAAGMLERLAQVLPELLAGFSHALDAQDITRLQDSLGEAIAGLQSITAETRFERLASPWHSALDLAPLARTLLRLRHDLVIVGRAAIAPLPETFMTPLGPPLTQVGESICGWLRGCATALMSRQTPPPFLAVQSAIGHYTARFAALRQQGLTVTLPAPEIERIFALGFALEQLHRDLLDLQRCVEDGAKSPAPAKTATAP